ncbi:hypothetical protein J6590_043225 [Homalodisca vitripennis]|nr:hypothetical protein J6590_043225 [Homalodisca vitripennis]
MLVPRTRDLGVVTERQISCEMSRNSCINYYGILCHALSNVPDRQLFLAAVSGKAGTHSGIL